MQTLMEEVLSLQPSWSARNTPAMQRRGEIVRRDMPAWLRPQIPSLVPPTAPLDDLRVQGRDGTGQKTEIPWTRAHSASRSPSATEGWYVVYLFAANGSAAYASLNQATTRWEDGDFKPRAAAEISARVAWAQDVLTAAVPARPDLVDTIALHARTRLGAGYEPGNVVAFEYPRRSVPAPPVLGADLAFLLKLLAALYLAEEVASPPGEPPPEVLDAVTAADVRAGRRPRRPRYRQSAAERVAIERRAVRVATEHLESVGFTVRDVGSRESYDLDARKAGQRLYVEVKGTTSAGEEVVLTKAEVDLHRREHPSTMLAVVTGIVLDRSTEPPTATGGSLGTITPWKAADDDLTAISYRYAVPPTTP